MPARPLVPDYAGACLTNLVPALLGPDGTGRPAGLVPGAGARGPPGRAARARRPGLGAAARALGPGADAGRHGRPAHRRRRAHDHGHVADQHRHRPHPRRARRRRLPDGHARRGAQRAALEHAGGRRPPPHRARRGAAPAPVPRQLRARRGQGRVRRQRLHARPPGRRAPRRLAAAVQPGGGGRRAPARGRAVRLRLLRRDRQGGARVRAGRALRRRAGRPPTAWWRTWLAVLPPGAVLLVTADHGQVDVPETLPLAPEVVGLHAPAVGRGPVPLAPRPRRGARPSCSTPPPPPTRQGLGGAGRAGARRGLVRARG